MDAFEAVLLGGYGIENVLRIFEQSRTEALEIEQPHYHGSHPRLSERLDDAHEFISTRGVSTHGAAGSDAEERAEYDDRIADLLLATAKLSFDHGYRRKARRAIDRYLSVRPESLDGHLFRAELAASRMARPEHRDAAIRSYREIIRLDPEHADAHRSLGLMLVSSPDLADGLAALSRYLELEPEAIDRAVIEAYLANPPRSLSRGEIGQADRGRSETTP